MRRNILGFSALSALVLASCSSHPAIEAPPVQPLVQELPPPPLSHLAVPIAVQLDPLRDKILHAVPVPLSQGAEDKNVEMNIRPKQGMIANLLGKALPAQVKAPVAVQLRHRLTLAGLDLTVQGNRLTAVADVDLSVGTTAKIPVSAIGLASCGENGAPPARIRFTMPGTLVWTGDGQLSWVREKWSMQWLRPCELTALHLDLGSVLNLPLVRGKVEEAISAQLAKLPEAFAVRPVAEKAWAQLSQPREVAKGMWLCARPESLSVSGVSGSGKTVTTVVTMAARPQMLLSEAAPVLDRPALPPIRTVAQAPSPRFSMDFTAEIPLAHADSLLTAILSAHPYRSGSHEAVVKSGRIYASGGKAVLGLGLTKPFAGDVYVLGVPVFDTVGAALAFDSVDYSLSSSSALARTADWLLHGTFRSQVAKAAKVDFGKQLAGIRQKLSKLEMPAGDGVTLRGGVQRVVPTSVDISATALRVHVRAEGTVQVDVGR